MVSNRSHPSMPSRLIRGERHHITLLFSINEHSVFISSSELRNEVRTPLNDHASRPMLPCCPWWLWNLDTWIIPSFWWKTTKKLRISQSMEIVLYICIGIHTQVQRLQRMHRGYGDWKPALRWSAVDFRLDQITVLNETTRMSDLRTGAKPPHTSSQRPLLTPESKRVRCRNDATSPHAIEMFHVFNSEREWCRMDATSATRQKCFIKFSIPSFPW